MLVRKLGGTELVSVSVHVRLPEFGDRVPIIIGKYYVSDLHARAGRNAWSLRSGMRA